MRRLFWEVGSLEKVQVHDERDLRIVYRKYNCLYNNLLKMDQSLTVYQRNIKSLAIELSKVKQVIWTQNDEHYISDKR